MGVFVVFVQSVTGTSSNAAPLAEIAWVCVGPPLLASIPSMGLALFWSPVPPSAQDASPATLCPRLVNVALQSAGLFPAMIVFFSVKLPVGLWIPAPPGAAVLPLTVLLTTVTVP